VGVDSSVVGVTLPGKAALEPEIALTLWEALTNPNVVYVLLIMGLGAAASAFYVPGTGLLEAVALVCLVLAILGLTRQPANIAGLALMVAAGVLFIVDLKVHSVGLTVVAAVALVLGSVFLFPSPGGPCDGSGRAARLSPWLIAGAAIGSLGFFAVALSAVARAQRIRSKLSYSELVGRRGWAVTPLDPRGAVQVESELWTAIADEDAAIGAGDEVEVIAIDGLTLMVERASRSEP
jgi:membrane-bound serine protease (ClpP class)